MGSNQSHCPRQRQGGDLNQQPISFNAIHSNQEKCSQIENNSNKEQLVLQEGEKSRCWSLSLSSCHSGDHKSSGGAESSYEPSTTKPKCVHEENKKLFVENNNLPSFVRVSAEDITNPAVVATPQNKQVIPGAKSKKESRLTRCFTALNFGSMKNTIKTGCAPTVDASVHRNGSMPSMIAATVVGSWKNSSFKKQESINSSVGTNEPPADGLGVGIRGASVSDESLTKEETALRDYHLSDQSHEALMQIIRCFPFPSPKPSPRLQLLTRTASTDAPDHSCSTPVTPTHSSKTIHSAPLIPGPDLLVHSPWRITKRFLHRHHPTNGGGLAAFAKVCNVQQPPNGKCLVEAETQCAKSKTHCVLTSSPSTPAMSDGAQGRAVEDTSKEHSKGALGRLCQISVDTMAITALPLDCWLKERLENWVQLSGHAGTIVPASNHTLWKKQPSSNLTEANAYAKIMKDPALRGLTPKFFKEIMHKCESFIEIQDLLSQFPNTSARSIMDIKIGVRTFLECEVSNSTKRTDLYKKMVDIDPSEPSEEEHADKAITKLRYMQFRERESSTASLGFRIEAAQLPGGKLQKSFKKVRTKEQVLGTLLQFFGERHPIIRVQLCQRLKSIRHGIEKSNFFHNHEVVGSSILIVYDNKRTGAWMIDFAKSTQVPEGISLDHRSPWRFGNHEDGYLQGLDNLISILETD